MVSIPGLAGAAIGIPLGVFLRLTDQGGVLQNAGVNRVVGGIVNAVRSTPFIILPVAIILLTRFLREVMLAVREQDKDKPWVAKLVKAYHSEEIRKYVQAGFKGVVLAGF